MEKDISRYKKLIWGISAVLAFLPIYQIIQIQSEESASIIWGLSLSRLVLVMGVVMIGLVFGGMALFADRVEKRLPRWLSGKAVLTVWKNLTFIGALLFLWLGFEGQHDFVDWQEFYLRLRPVFQYFGLILLLWAGFFYLQNRSATRLPARTIFEQLNLPLSLIIFGIFLLVWTFVRFTGIGITPGYPYWGEAGTIIWGYQVILSLIVTLLLSAFLKKFVDQNPKRFDVLAFALLWITTVVLWNTADMGHNFFAPRQFSQPYFPYSDAALYDVNAYSILIGKGISFAQYAYRPMYIGFLAVLHALSGPNYTVLVALQVAVLALFVPGLYLVGREIHSRNLGFAVAIMGIISQLNSFVANEFVRVSNPKLLLTEFPTTVILVYVAYFYIAGIKDQKTGKKWVVAFGLLSVAFLIRLHVAVIFAALLVLLFVIDRRIKIQVRNSFLVASIAVMFVLPWMVRNTIAVGAFSLDPGRFNLLMEDRWGDSEEGQVREPILEQSAKTFRSPLSLPDSIRGQALVGKESLMEMLAHFLHNEVLSVLDLPQSIRFLTLRSYYQTEYTLTKDWAGELSPLSTTYLVANLVILSVGIGTAYKKRGWLGLVPLVIHLSYNFANALVRTSGWRYLIPTEWVPMLYYVLGVFQIVWMLRARLFSADEVAEPETRIVSSIQPLDVTSWLRVGAGFVALSVFVSFAPGLIPDQIQPLAAQDRQTYIKEVAENSDISVKQINQLLSSEGGILQVGKVLYPRFYFPDQGIFHRRSEVVDYPRVEFTLINDWVYQVRVPIGLAQNFLAHEMNVLVIGCRGTGNRIEALVVLPLEESNSVVMMRNTEWTTSCPLPTP